MKSLTKAFIGGSVLAAGGGAFGLYKALSPQKPVLSYDQMWDGRLKLLEKELVRLHKNNPRSATELAEKISPSAHVLFAIDPNKNSFHDGDSTQQRGELDKFCAGEDKRGVQENLIKQFCG